MKKKLGILCAYFALAFVCGCGASDVGESVPTSHETQEDTLEDAVTVSESDLVESLKAVFNPDNYNLDCKLKTVSRFTFAPSYEESDKELALTYSPLATARAILHAEYNKETDITWYDGVVHYEYDGSVSDTNIGYYSIPNMDGTHSLYNYVCDENEQYFWIRDNDFGVVYTDIADLPFAEVVKSAGIRELPSGYELYCTVPYADCIEAFRTYFGRMIDRHLHRGFVGYTDITILFDNNKEFVSLNAKVSEPIMEEDGRVETFELEITPVTEGQITEVPREVVVGTL